MRYSAPSSATISQLNASGIDADLNMGARKITAAEIDTDVIDDAAGLGLTISPDISLSGALNTGAGAIAGTGTITMAAMVIPSTTITNTTGTTDSDKLGYFAGGADILGIRRETAAYFVPLSFTFYLKKVGDPSAMSAISCAILKASDDTVLATAAATLPIASLTTSYAAYTFSFTPILITASVPIRIRIGGTTVGGDAGNHVLARKKAGVYAGEKYTAHAFVGAWSDNAAAGLDCIEKYGYLVSAP